MSKESFNLGRSGEETAVGLLKANGYKILKTNYRTRFAEIDIIARDKDTLCFVEVKTRRKDRFGTAAESVIPEKQRRIYRAAAKFLKENHLFDHKSRFDVVTVTFIEDRFECELIKNAFVLEDEFNY